MSSLIETWKREIDVQQPRNAELLTSHIDNLVFLFGTGMTYYFVLNFWKFELEYVSSNIAEHLDVSSGDIRIEELLTVLHPSDQVSISKKEEIVLQFFAEIPVENYGDYKPSYFLRVRLKDGSYRTVLHQSSVLSISNDDKVEQVLTVHTDVTHLNLPYNNDVVILKKGAWMLRGILL